MRVSHVSLLLSALPAAIFYGALAAAANSGHGVSVAVQAAVVQALISYTSTLVALSLMFRLANLLSGYSAVIRRSIVPLTIISVFSSVSIIIHLTVDTPNVLLTVAPSFFIGWVYFTVVYWLKDSSQAVPDTADPL
ncbi:hypothetical protein KKQ10_25600 [Pseudomonas sp. MG-9]|uniref:Uncharacterized protein n=1 Tax=Pseudomonas serboccidentalis TaxID=2964670 RepID=A0ABY7ZEU1_9PSED|nr:MULTISPECIES: hypothetical protein [Pseudomonas]MBT9268259.1 hypothetical protein [Pseudomonas sp. MG-9]WDR37641.1 hypothetical protein NN484_07875 [Pseudomonas serboccidentalis]